MKPIEMQVSVSLADESVQALAEALVPLLRQSLATPIDDLSQRSEARRLQSQRALFAGQKPPENLELLISSRQAAKLLKISERTLWRMQNEKEIPAPVRIGRAVRWDVETLKMWVSAGCPKPT